MNVRMSHNTGNAKNEPGMSSSSKTAHHLCEFTNAIRRFHMVENLVRSMG
jgi:hypothetical protein